MSVINCDRVSCSISHPTPSILSRNELKKSKRPIYRWTTPLLLTRFLWLKKLLKYQNFLTIEADAFWIETNKCGKEWMFLHRWSNCGLSSLEEHDPPRWHWAPHGESAESGCGATTGNVFRRIFWQYFVAISFRRAIMNKSCTCTNAIFTLYTEEPYTAAGRMLVVYRRWVSVCAKEMQS